MKPKDIPVIFLLGLLSWLLVYGLFHIIILTWEYLRM